MLRRSSFYKIQLLLVFIFLSGTLLAQRDIFRDIETRIPRSGPVSSQTGNDSLRSRNKLEDSVTVRIYHLDSTFAKKLDSSVADYSLYFPIPPTHIFLGNTGTATRSILFEPTNHPGFDAGFHAFDVYKWSLPRVRFFNTTRPFTELGYTLASKAEQIIEVLHTQNIRPTWNAAFQYRLINAPGFFRNQKTNHNNYLFTSWYQSVSRRYNNYFMILANHMQSGENGGIKNDKDYLKDPIYGDDRFTIPTKIGGQPAYGTDFFSSDLYTGNKYKELTIFLRQQYDLGKKDSLVTDSTVVPLFYPRLRFEHSFKYGNNDYRFIDIPKQDNDPDVAYYRRNYDISFRSRDGLKLRDRWKEVDNDFSIYQFPDAKNLHQFFKVGIQAQLLYGRFQNNIDISRPIADSQTLFEPRGKDISSSLYNVAGHAEYRNRTKNQKWDMFAQGKIYLNGYNEGDYYAFLSLERASRIGSLKLGFENRNSSPPFIFDSRSSFYFIQPEEFNKENLSHFFGTLTYTALKARLSAHYYLIGNYLYLNGFRQLQQEGTLFNVLRVDALKTFRIGRSWNWHAEIYMQQKTGSAELQLPLLFTRHRLGYEGNLGFKNLNIAMGIEMRYHTPYKADHYSPVLGRFFYQDTATISNLPQLDAYVNFRIRSLSAFLRAENLNTAQDLGGFHFNNHNLAAIDYPTPGLLFRFGVLWRFVN